MLTLIVIMVGASGNQPASFSSHYLHTGSPFWTMSPNRMSLNPLLYIVDNLNLTQKQVNTDDISYSYGIRPVISLKLGTEFEDGGNGTPTNPYVVKYE